MKPLKTILALILLTCMSIGIVNAQNTRKDKKAAHAAEIKSMVEAQNYLFNASYVTPMRGISRSLNSQYDMTVTKDTVSAYLPYFGQAYQAPYNPTDGGIKFTTTKFTYSSKVGKKGGWTVTIKPTDRSISDGRDVQTMTLNISQDGFASLQVISTNRDPISFNGTIEKRDIKK
ncbi:DUF4251 domain-containing protein [Mucilaginibacter aquaedulcis]|jgi:hypothetical protein|uniref:DUF4251 domain-containing protein n=1 Tax=Mucilaginibacter aquaedulcis TaxID=1187081 RepID=UPI0025B57037|nr:DUF4251 domain-containing protein [Mucilaginibacter aquaedulcis]MDN3547880.1 DUF4251 domain-containing protein [Mucilaginibacter aquaedulcis]